VIPSWFQLFVVDEAVLRRPIADHDAWLAQLAHLANSNRLPSVTVRVLPSIAGPHRASTTNAFYILDFPAMGIRPPEPSTVSDTKDRIGGILTFRPDAWRSFLAEPPRRS
jgi:hypothetical protein